MALWINMSDKDGLLNKLPLEEGGETWFNLNCNPDGSWKEENKKEVGIVSGIRIRGVFPRIQPLFLELNYLDSSKEYLNTIQLNIPSTDAISFAKNILDYYSYKDVI
jgi:hypothetical protein